MKLRHASQRARAVCALLAASALLLSACANNVSTLESGRSVHAELKAAEAAGGNTESETPAPHPHLPGEIPVMNNGEISWLMPAELGTWRYAPAQDANITQFLSTTGCRFASSHHRFTPQPGADDRKATEEQVAQWIALHERNNVASESTAELSTEIGGVGIGPVEMIRVTTDFTAPDGISHRSTAWLRVFATAKTPTVTTLNFSCPVETYSEGELEQLKLGTLINNVERPFMH